MQYKQHRESSNCREQPRAVTKDRRQGLSCVVKTSSISSTSSSRVRESLATLVLKPEGKV